LTNEFDLFCFFLLVVLAELFVLQWTPGFVLDRASNKFCIKCAGSLDILGSCSSQRQFLRRRDKTERETDRCWQQLFLRERDTQTLQRSILFAAIPVSDRQTARYRCCWQQFFYVRETDRDRDLLCSQQFLRERERRQRICICVHGPVRVSRGKRTSICLEHGSADDTR
jgi:hypothetical protein